MILTTLSHLLAVGHKEDSTTGLIVALFFFGPPLFFLIRYMYMNRHAHLWEDGYFPEGLKFNKDNLMEAYICLGARLIQSDTEEAGEKLLYMNSYFRKHFPNSHYNFSESLSYSYSHPIRLKSITYWLRTHIHKKEQRIQVLYFLAGMSVVDGSINSAEEQLLERIADLLEITPKEFRSVIAMYTRYEEERKSSIPRISKRKLIRKQSCEILGVSEYASMDEIKKAYRNLAKLHHPDRFVNESEDQQRLANERFVKIQNAYDFLERNR